MADDDLIEVYLARLRASLRWHPAATDLLDEAADHLYEVADHLARDGLDEEAAQARALKRFGDASVVARAFATTPSGGIAMPTQLTRTSGTMGLLAALGWLAASLALVVGGTEALAQWDLLAYVVFAALTTLSAALTLVTICGLLVRSGGFRGVLATVAVVGGAGAAFMLGAFTWGWPLGATVLALAVGSVVWRLHAAGASTARADWVAVAAWPVGIAALVALTLLEVGPVDEYGDHWVASVAGFVTAAVLFAGALARMGAWLRSEEPVDLGPPMAHA